MEEVDLNSGRKKLAKTLPLLNCEEKMNRRIKIIMKRFH